MRTNRQTIFNRSHSSRQAAFTQGGKKNQKKWLTCVLMMFTQIHILNILAVKGYGGILLCSIAMAWRTYKSNILVHTFRAWSIYIAYALRLIKIHIEAYELHWLLLWTPYG